MIEKGEWVEWLTSHSSLVKKEREDQKGMQHGWGFLITAGIPILTSWSDIYVCTDITDVPIANPYKMLKPIMHN